MDFIISKDIYDKNDFEDDGNRFLIGNGYIGVRGTLDEYKKGMLVAVNLSGIYDKVGSNIREPLNAPNPFYTYVEVDGKRYSLPDMLPYEHNQELDFRHGIFRRKTSFKNERGIIEVKSERFVSMDNVHVFGCKFSARSSYNCKINIISGIDGNVWDMNGPHYTNIDFKEIESMTICNGFCENSNQSATISKKNFFEDSDHNNITLIFLGAIFTTKDCVNPEKEAIALVSSFNSSDYELEKKKSMKKWEDLWSICEVEIDGDHDAHVSMNYSLYHLNSIAPRHAKNLSIPARGLSGQVYKGAIFWDSEMFMLDYFLYTQPEVAKSIISYRINSLPGAILKAKEYGYEGAFYPWESQEKGFDACSDFNVIDVFTKRPLRTYFKDKQVHISSAIVYGIMKYFNHTLDYEILINGGAETIIQCAKFYLSLFLKPFYKDRYEIHDVVGPDEYHERVNNNAYTNRMAKMTIDSAIEIINLLRDKFPLEYDKINNNENLEKLLSDFTLIHEKIYIKEPNSAGIIEQFDGYFNLEDVSLSDLKKRLIDPKEYWGGHGIASQTKVIKQADVVAMLEIFSGEYDEDILRKNWEYYETLTEHGSSLSACMYGLLACRFNEQDKAYPFFLKSAKAEILGGGKQWAGLIYIGGTHPAASGGAYKVLIQGFSGLHFENGEPKLKPRLPRHWKRLSFKFLYKDKKYKAIITKKDSFIEEVLN